MFKKTVIAMFVIGGAACVGATWFLSFKTIKLFEVLDIDDAYQSKSFKDQRDICAGAYVFLKKHKFDVQEAAKDILMTMEKES